MKRSLFVEAQFIGMLKKQEAGLSTAAGAWAAATTSFGLDGHSECESGAGGIRVDINPA